MSAQRKAESAWASRQAKTAQLPREPSLAMLDAGWGICGTALNDMQPCPLKIALARSRYDALLSEAEKVIYR